MTHCAKNNTHHFTRLPLLLSTLLLLSLPSCTQRDDAFGNDLVPPGQHMRSTIDSTVLVHTYISTCDSLETSVSGYYEPLVGSYIDPLTGRIDIQAFVNYSPYGFRHSHYFGENPVIDSMRYAITFTGAIGDTAKSVTVDVYEVKDYHFHQDSAYFSNFDMSPYIGATPLFSFEQKGPGTSYGRLPDEFAKRLLDNTQSKENIYYNDTLFHKKFPGLYFKLRNQATAGEEGTLLKMDMAQSTMYLFYHNTGPNGLDTLDQQILFYSDRTYDYICFTTIQHDYTLSDPSKGGVPATAIGDTTHASEYMYVQGLAGLMGQLRIEKSQLEHLQQQAVEQGYSHIALHRAELKVRMVDSGYEQYNKSFTGLGLYHNMIGYEFLDEYNPILDAITTNNYTATLGGSLNRSLGIYTFDITSYVQQLLTGKEERYTTELLPAYLQRNDTGRSWIYGSNSPYPPLLVLTYTLIK